MNVFNRYGNFQVFNHRKHEKLRNMFNFRNKNPVTQTEPENTRRGFLTAAQRRNLRRTYQPLNKNTNL